MLEIHSPDEHRQLVTQCKRIVDQKVIAQGVQNAAEGDIRFPAIAPVQLLHQFFEPEIGPLNRGVQHLKTGEFHAQMNSTLRAVTFAERR